ncbi:MAG TPA: hypothetical protein VIK91_13065 [Nannocystis sp.]
MSTDLATLTPLPCRSCGGAGEVQRADYLLTKYGVRTTYRSAACDRCDGTGEELCGYCGESAAVTHVDGVPACAGCAEEEE